jgi:polyribonucleotide nucleotidyltransferase
VDSDLVGLVIGQGGSTIKRVADKYQVSIIIERDTGKSQSNKRRVQVTGRNIEEVQKAIEEISV